MLLFRVIRLISLGATFQQGYPRVEDKPGWCKGGVLENFQILADGWMLRGSRQVEWH